MSHYLTIKIQTDPVNDAFSCGNMGNELSRILKKYADSIKYLLIQYLQLIQYLY